MRARPAYHGGMRHGWLAAAPDPLRVVRNDAIAAAVFAAVSLLLLVLVIGGSAPLGLVQALAHAAMLAIRRTAPVLFGMLGAVTAGVMFGVSGIVDPFTATFVLMGVYGIAAFAPRRWHALGLLSLPAAALLLGAESLVRRGEPIVSSLDELILLLLVLVFVTALYAAAWGLGLARRAQFDTRVRERERLQLLERDAHRLAELAVADERSRIAREMHDIIAHSLASIITLAEGGRMAAGRDPRLGTQLFERIGDAGRDALTDVKRLLRTVDDGQDDAPARGVEQLPELVENAAFGGLPITFASDGAARPLPAGLSLAVYRVAQESITNVLRHAPGTRTEVRLRWTPERLVLEVENEADGAPAASSSGGSGRGLAGMRERVELFDGEFAANRTGGRFCVRADWPLPDHDPRPKANA